MSKRMTALSGRVMGMLGIPAPSADAEQEPVVTEPVDPPAGDDGEGGDPPPTEPPPTEPVEAAPEAAPADEAEQTALVKEAAAIATQQANTRWQTVLASEEAKGRGKLAVHLLATTDATADAVIATLKMSPAGGDFAARMAETPNPGVTAAGGGADPDVPNAQAGWNKSITKVRGGLRN